jgi:putative SOS response-associated peptidase YedK
MACSSSSPASGANGQGDVGTIKQPNVGLHRLYAILTTEPNGVVQPIHDKAMPVMLMTAEDVDV